MRMLQHLFCVHIEVIQACSYQLLEPRDLRLLVVNLWKFAVSPND
jgi:hypothetical protein